MSDNPSAFPTHDQTPTTDPRERILQGGMEEWKAKGGFDAAAKATAPAKH